MRAFVKCLDGISDQEISELEIPTGIPLVYELDESLRPLERYYLGNSPVAAKAQEALDHLVRISENMHLMDPTLDVGRNDETRPDHLTMRSALCALHCKED